MTIEIPEVPPHVSDSMPENWKLKAYVPVVDVWVAETNSGHGAMIYGDREDPEDDWEIYTETYEELHGNPDNHPVEWFYL